MVGIVIVSHSHKLAEGVAELAREMAGPDARIATAGGLDLPDHPIGTDAVKVIQAIELVDGEDGVVVLMDLGSGILSAEMALELLAPEQRARVRLCGAPLVEGAIAAAAQARLGAPIDQVIAEARAALGPKHAQLGEADAAAPLGIAAPDAAAQNLRLKVPNRLGFHARPVARLVQALSSCDAAVSARNLTTGAGPASASSLNSLLLLGARQGHEIEFTATGAGAPAALHAIQALAEHNFGDADGPDGAQPEGFAAEPALTVVPDGALRGVGASPGLAIGHAALVAATISDPAAGEGGPEQQWLALQAAIERTRGDLATLRQATAARSCPSAAAIFDAQRLVLADDDLLSAARREIFDRGRAAPDAMRAATEAVAVGFEALSDAYLRARAADVRDVGQQVIAALAGAVDAGPTFDQGDGPVIVIAEDFSPSGVARLSGRDGIAGLCAARGAATGHAAILARALGLPAVFGLGQRILHAPAGAMLALDGSAGWAVIDPGEITLADVREAMARERDAAARALATRHEPAVTRDGRRIEIAANIGSLADAAAALEAGAEAVGLFRTEFVFLDRASAPSEDEQVATYRAVAGAMGGRSVIVRTLDVGGDKPLPYLDLPREENPFLGLRGLRFCLAHPELFLAQLRAIARVATEFPLKVMFPMVSTLNEWRAARALWERARAEVGRATPIEVGIMVEVPAAALSAESFAPEVDFFSIGTNDLTQYTFAAERGNPAVAGLNDARHPALLALIERVCAAAHAHGKWVGVCGELAGDPAAAPVLISLGVDELSMNLHAISQVKQAVRAHVFQRQPR